ncbi:MAG TPA: helix-turn-helix domain-containing protein [Gaiellaceae bacterium]
MNELEMRLAAARAERGWSLADAERETGIRTKYLAALERGDLDALPGWAYARAFLRTYARALGLDADGLVAEFEEDVPPPLDEIEPVGLPHPRRLPVRGIVGVALVAGALALVLWAAVSSHSTKLPPPAQAAPPAQQVAPQPALVTPPSAQVTTTTQTASNLVVRATRGRCWLIVRAGGTAGGTVLFEGTLGPGETKTFAEQDLWLRFGAPASVDVTRGGKAVSGLAGSSPVDVVA